MKDFAAAVPDKSIDATKRFSKRRMDVAYHAIRGREQDLIEAAGGAKSQKGTAANRINGISSKNPQRDTFMNASRRIFGVIK